MKDSTQLWRVSFKGRAGAVVVLLGWSALTLCVTIGGNHTPGAGESPTVLLWVMTIAIALGAWRCAFVPYVEDTPSELVVQNPFTKVRTPWSQIQSVSPGSLGLIIHTKGRKRPTIAWAVQKGRGARVRGTHTRADDVAAALMAHAFAGRV